MSFYLNRQDAKSAKEEINRMDRIDRIKGRAMMMILFLSCPSCLNPPLSHSFLGALGG
jgi:hypothetical protein